MILIDCFTFYNELDMLEMRLAELNDVVDKFVIVEATRTFTGKEKQLFFENNKDRYAKYLDKIVHVVEDDLSHSNPWANESKQRNTIHKGIELLNLSDEDLIIISDVDEIPDSNTLAEVKLNNSISGIACLVQDMYYYNLTCRSLMPCRVARIVNYQTYKISNSPQAIRRTPPNTFLPKGGWHFTYFGDIEFIKNKIQNFSHQEYNNDEIVNDEYIKNVVLNQTDIFKRSRYTYNYIDPKENKYLPKNFEILLKFNINE